MQAFYQLFSDVYAKYLKFFVLDERMKRGCYREVFWGA